MAPRYCLIIFVMTIALVVLSPRIARISKVAHLFLLVITQYHVESYGARTLIVGYEHLWKLGRQNLEMRLISYFSVIIIYPAPSKTQTKPQVGQRIHLPSDQPFRYRRPQAAAD